MDFENLLKGIPNSQKEIALRTFKRLEAIQIDESNYWLLSVARYIMEVDSHWVYRNFFLLPNYVDLYNELKEKRMVDIDIFIAIADSFISDINQGRIVLL